MPSTPGNALNDLKSWYLMGVSVYTTYSTIYTGILVVVKQEVRS